MSKTNLIKDILDGKITDAKVFEIVADLSLCVGELTPKECGIIDRRYNCIFNVIYNNGGKSYIYLRAQSPKKDAAHFYNLIEEENLIRKMSGDTPIFYDRTKIKF